VPSTTDRSQYAVKRIRLRLDGTSPAAEKGTGSVQPDCGVFLSITKADAGAAFTEGKNDGGARKAAAPALTGERIG
jgi:hypothetical protein